MKKCEKYQGCGHGCACIDGRCPIARREEREEYSMDTPKDCDECWYYKSCDSCIHYRTRTSYINGTCYEVGTCKLGLGL